MSLNETRMKINQIDDEITKLFLTRMELVKEVIEYKKANNLPILDSTREASVISRVIDLIDNHQLDDYITRVFEVIMQVSKDYQNEL